MLIGKGLYIRPVEPADIDLLYQWENDTDNWKVSNTLVPFSKNLLTKYVDAVADIFEAKQVRFIICLTANDKAVGAIDLFDYDPFHQRAGIGILIGDKEERGKGAAREALNLAITYGFEILALQQLYCNIFSNNEASTKLFSKAGFKVTGTRKKWMRTRSGWEDVNFMQLFNPGYPDAFQIEVQD